MSLLSVLLPLEIFPSSSEFRAFINYSTCLPSLDLLYFFISCIVSYISSQTVGFWGQGLCLHIISFYTWWCFYKKILINWPLGTFGEWEKGVSSQSLRIIFQVFLKISLLFSPHFYSCSHQSTLRLVLFQGLLAILRTFPVLQSSFDLEIITSFFLDFCVLINQITSS